MKIFEEGMFLKTFSTTLLQIFCKISINSKVIIKSIIDPDDNCWRNSLSINGLNLILQGVLVDLSQDF